VAAFCSAPLNQTLAKSARFSFFRRRLPYIVSKLLVQCHVDGVAQAEATAVRAAEGNPRRQAGRSNHK
jgi:hypothetical protein